MASRSMFSRLAPMCRVLRGQVAPVILKARSAQHISPVIHCQRIMPISAAFHTSVPRSNEFIINIQDEADFEERVKLSKVPVIVDFHATWCGPCKILGPRLETMITAQKGKVILAKVDIDDNSDLAIEHGVSAVPTVLGIRDGRPVDMFVGVKDDGDLGIFINKVVGE